MLIRLLVLCSTLTLALACSDDEKSDTQQSNHEITPTKFSVMEFTYRDTSNVLKSYRLHFPSGNLVGSWERIDNADKRTAATSKKIVRSKGLEIFKVAVVDLNTKLESVDRSGCGVQQDSSSAALVLTSKTSSDSKLRISEAQDLTATCADKYVADGTFEHFIHLFEKTLPEPQLQ